MVESHTPPRRQLVGADGDKRSRGTARPEFLALARWSAPRVPAPTLRARHVDRWFAVRPGLGTMHAGEIARGRSITRARDRAGMRTGMCDDMESLGEVRAVRVRTRAFGVRAIGRQASRAGQGESAMLAPFHFHVSLHSRSVVHAPCFSRSHRVDQLSAPSPDYVCSS